MSFYDYTVIGFYFVFMLIIGWVFRKHGKDTSDYFRGGGSMTWWMVGASSFVQTFSAWTFVGVAGVIYSRGSLVSWIFFSNFLGTIICMLFTAGKFRRLRVITWVEALKERYGKGTEQLYAYINLLLGVIVGGSGLYILAIFMSALFGLRVDMTIIAVGLVVTAMSAFGGVWATTASDFVQLLIIMTVICVTAVLVIFHPEVGGITGFFDKLPDSHLKWGFDVSWGVLVIWLILQSINSICVMNSLAHGAARMLVVKDEKSAVKALWIPLIGYLVLPMLAFIPSLAATFLFPNIDQMFPQLNFPKEAGYAAVSMKVLPMGMVGLLACAMFSATMSSMDSGLNRNAAIFVKNIYQRIIRPHCCEKEAMLTAKISTIFFGILLIFTGLQWAKAKDMPIFELGMMVIGPLSQPMLIPLVLAIFIKKVPRWTASSTVGVGLLVSLLTMNAPLVEIATDWFGELTAQDKIDISWVVPNLLVTIVCFAWFFFSMLFYKPPKDGSQAAIDVESFFRKQRTPIDLKAEKIIESDGVQAKTMGRLNIAYGIFILMGILIPNGIIGRLAFFFVGGSIISIGILLQYAGRRQDAKTSSQEDYITMEQEPEVQQSGL